MGSPLKGWSHSKQLAELTAFALGVTGRLLFLWFTVRALAVGLGADGFAVSMQLLTFVGLITLISGGGIGVGLTNQYGQSFKSDLAKYKVIKKAVYVGLTIGGLLGVILYLNADYFSRQLFGDVSQAERMRIFALFVWIVGIQTNLFACMTASRSRFLQAFAMLFSSVMLFMCVFYGLKFYGSSGAFSGVLFGALPAASVVMFWAYISHHKVSNEVSPTHFLRNPNNKSLLGFSAVTLITALFATVPQLVVRQHIAENLDWAEAGRWSAVMKLSEIYCQFFVVFLAHFYHPVLLKEVSHGNLCSIIRQTQLKIATATIALFALILLGSEYLIAIAFGEQIKASRSELSLVMLGDLCKLLSYCATYVLIVKNRIGHMLFFEMLQASLIYGLGFFLFNSASFDGFLIGYALGHVVYLICVVAFVFNDIRLESAQ
jgi:hypothetical protein